MAARLYMGAAATSLARPALGIAALVAAAGAILLPVDATAAQRRSLLLKTEPIAQASSAPRTALVSIRRQRLRLFDGNREIASSRISSGMSGFDTPTGVFSILEKKTYHESNIYEGAPMPFMQRLTWSGIALHAGVVPGYRASHGCIRLPASFAKSLFGQTDVGMRVIITQDDVSPVRFEHAGLFKPLPENDPPTLPTQAAAEHPQIAANDATPAGKEVLNTIVAGSAAAAEAAAPQNGKPRSRAEARRMLSAKLERLATELKTAEETKVAASETAKAALRAAQDAEARYNDVRKPFEAVLRTAAQAESSRDAAARAYRTFLTRSDAKPAVVRGGDTKIALTVEDRELDLEDRVLDATVEADAAKAGSADAERAIGEAKTAFTTADAGKQKAMDEVRTAVIALRTAQTALVEARAEVTRRNRPLSIFISLKSNRIYLRQGFEPVLEAPIDVDDPPGAIGTHVLTAMDYDQTGNGFSWQLVSAQQPRPASALAADDNRGRKKKDRQTAAVSPGSPLNQEAARVALDSVRIPQDIVDMIAELAKPGTSLIISEKDPSPKETGKGTEFVVLTR